MNKAVNAMRLFSLAVVLVLVASCRDKNNKPDVSNIKIDVQLQRFDRDFFSIDTNHIENSLDQLYRNYPSFMPLYFEFLSPINYIVHQEGKSYKQVVLEYLRTMKSLEDSVQRKYSDLSAVENGLERNLRYVKYYYPSFKIPAVFTSVESLNPEDKTEIYGTTYYRDTLIISLQMFLGKDFGVYDPTLYFDYIRRRFESQYIVPNSIRAIANSIYADSSDEASFIEQIIEKGKQWYLLDHFLPDTPDSLKTFFTQKQLQWCRENEGNIWGQIIKNTPDLYTVDKETAQTYLGEAPFTQNIEASNSTPGNVGQWIGWQIVKKYAERNSSQTLQQVLATPAKQIFQEAKYKPK
jgi:hypothetical protein